MARVASIAFLAVFCLVLPILAFGQAGLGLISGTVQDPSGAVVPGAAVRLQEVSTQAVRTVTTNDIGLFNFPSVPVGSYSITITRAGFRDKRLESINVNAFQQLSLGAVVLEVGQGTATVVTVTAEQLLVKETPVRYETVLARQVAEMPLQGRNWATLLKIIPGSNPSGSSAYNGREQSYYGYSDFVINGKSSGQTQVNLDGGSIVDQGSDGKTTVTPSLESIEEVSILTNNYQAEYGIRGGTVINVVTKSGSNDYHWTLFDYLRNEALNANSWQRNYDGLPRARYRYNYFGGNIGGPVKKNKLFFFYNYENFDQTTPADPTKSRTPTALERNGDFSQTINSNGSRPTIYVPGSQAAGNAVPLPNRTLPVSQITTWGRKFMDMFPLENNPGTPWENYILTFERKVPRFSHVGKVDWNITDNTRAYVRLTNDGGTEQNRNTGFSGGNLTRALMERPRPDRALTASLTRMVKPTVIMENMFSWSYDNVQWNPVDPDGIRRETYGLKDLPSLMPFDEWLPEVSGLPYPGWNGNRTPATAIAHEYQFSTVFSWTRGAHFIKFGGQFIEDTKVEIDTTNDRHGTYNFGASSTSPYDTNYGATNLLLGALSSYQQIEGPKHKNSVYKDYHFFIQDTWKVTSSLTLDFGLRVYHVPSQYQRDPKDSLDAVFLPSKYDRSKAPRIYIPDPKNKNLIIDPAFPDTPLPSAVAGVLRYTLVPGSGDPLNGVFALGEPGVGRAGLPEPNWLLFAPRGGFAWSPGGNRRTVIRGGFGWAYNRENIAQSLNDFSNGLANIVRRTQTTIDLLSSSAGQSPIQIRSYGTRDEGGGPRPTTYDYSLSFQHELPFGTVVETAYIGNLQRHQPMQWNRNELPLGTLWDTKNVDPRNTGYNFYGPISGSNPGPALPGSNAMDGNVMRRFYGLGTLNMNANVGNRRYDSFQLSANKRFGKGLSLQFAYTLARLWTQTSNVGLYDYKWKDYSGFDDGGQRRHVANINYTYDVPGISRLLGMDNSFGRRVFDGWSLAHMMTFFSGGRYSPGYSIQQANTTSTVSLGNVFLGTGDLTPRLLVSGDPYANSDSFAHRFDPTVFSMPGFYPQTDGTGARNYMMGYGTFANDLSVIKNVQIAERHRFELRVSLYNAFNQVRRTGLASTSITYRANGKTYADGFTIYNTPELNAARTIASGKTDPKTVYNSYRTGVGHMNVTSVDPMRVIEIGLKYRF